MSVTIGFSTPKKWNPLSWLIKKLTKSEVSHAWLLVDDPVFGVRMVMDSHLTGLRLIPFEHFLEGSTVLALVVPQWDLDQGLLKQSKDIGDGYDVWGLAGVAYVRLMWIWFRSKVRSPLRSPGALFCSEAVTRVLQFSKYPESEILDPEGVSPEDLLTFFKNSPACAYVHGAELKIG